MDARLLEHLLNEVEEAKGQLEQIEGKIRKGISGPTVEPTEGRMAPSTEMSGEEGHEGEEPQEERQTQAPTPAAPTPAAPTPAAPKRRPDEGEPTLSDEVRAALAFFVVFFVIFSLVLAWFFLGIEEAQRASAFLLPLVGGILGYYFGSQGKKAAQTQAQRANKEARTAEAKGTKAAMVSVSMKKVIQEQIADILKKLGEA